MIRDIYLYFTAVEKMQEYYDIIRYPIVKSKCFIRTGTTMERTTHKPTAFDSMCSKRPFRISCFSTPTEFERRERRERRERKRESTVAGLVSSLRRSDTSRKTKRTRSGGMGWRKECLPRVFELSSHYRSYLSTVDRVFLRA